MQVDHHLVYADIGPSPLTTISNTFDLNDDRVEYVQINYTRSFLKRKAEHLESVANKQAPVPGKYISSSGICYSITLL